MGCQVQKALEKQAFTVSETVGKINISGLSISNSIGKIRESGFAVSDTIGKISKSGWPVWELYGDIHVETCRSGANFLSPGVRFFLGGGKFAGRHIILTVKHPPPYTPDSFTCTTTQTVQQVQTIERIVELLQIQCQDVVRHMTVAQIQEVIWQVTVLPRWCLRLMSYPCECVFVESDMRYNWNPSMMLPGTASHRPISQTHASRSTTKDCSTGAQIQSPADARCQTSWSVRSGRAVMSMTSRRTSATCQS